MWRFAHWGNWAAIRWRTRDASIFNAVEGCSSSPSCDATARRHLTCFFIRDISRTVAHILVEEHHWEAALNRVDAVAPVALHRVAQHLHIAAAGRTGEDTFEVDLASRHTLLA